MDWIAILILLVRCLVLALAATTLFAYFTLFERRLLARFQNRVGPNRAGYIPLPGGKKLFGGFLQPDNPGGNTMGRCTSHQAELFFGGNAMTLARYPNKSPEGKTQWLKISKVNDVQGEFQVADENVLNWAEEPDAWIHGYWSYDWADSYLQVYSGL